MEIQRTTCVIRFEQLKSFKKIIEARNSIANFYYKKLKKLKDIDIINLPKNTKSGFYKFIIIVKKKTHQKLKKLC